MPRIDELVPKFVEFIPKSLDDGILYVSRKYGAVLHNCCCGCGNKVSTPLSPTGWSITGNHDFVSLHPSVGSFSLPCKSHYYIRHNRVKWIRVERKACSSRN